MDRLLDIAVLAGAMVALLACEWLGHRRWVRPLGGRATPAIRATVFILTLTLAGGFIGAFAWWVDVDSGFAWDVPPLGSRMLASAGWAFALASWSALERPTAGRLRLVLVMLVVYLAPLAVALVAFHLDRLDFGAPITYPFFAVIGLLIVGPALLLRERPAIRPDEAVDRESPSALMRGWLALVAAVTFAWSVALFVTDNGPIAAVWAWPGDALTSRLISAMLLTIAVAAVMGRNSRDLAGLTSRITLLYGVGLAAASLWLVTAGRPVNLAYVAAFGVLGAGSMAALILDRRDAAAVAEASTPSE